MLKTLLFVIGVLLMNSTNSLAGAYEDILGAIERNSVEEVTDLLRKGIDINSVSPDGESLLMLACRKGNPSLVQALLVRKPNVAFRGPHRETALMLASFNGHLEIVKLLIKAGSPVNQDDWTALSYAATNNHLNVARLLVGQGAKVNATTDHGISPLMMAAREGHLPMVLFLLEHGADPNLINQAGLSALQFARQNKRTAVEAILVKVTDSVVSK